MPQQFARQNKRLLPLKFFTILNDLYFQIAFIPVNMQIASTIPQTSTAQPIQVQVVAPHAVQPQTSTMQVQIQDSKPITLNPSTTNVIFSHPSSTAQNTGSQTVQRIIATHNGQPTEILQIVQPISTIQHQAQPVQQQMHQVQQATVQQLASMQPQVQQQAKPVQQRITLGKIAKLVRSKLVRS